MHERLKLIRKDSGLTQADFASAIGASRAMVAKYETNAVIPDKPIRMLICERFNINETWLETGEGKPYKEGLMPELVHALRNMPHVQSMLERLLPVMTVEDWRALDSVVERFLREKPPD